MKRVLLALESIALRNALRELLPQEFEVICCRYSEIRDTFELQQYDALVLDLFLPGTDGFTVLKQIGTLRPAVVILITRLYSQQIFRVASDLGINCVIRIPRSAAAVADRLRAFF